MVLDQVPLELRQGREHMENQPARCAVCFDLLGQALESDAALFQLGHDLHQVRQAAPESIQSPHHEGVTFAQGLSTLFKLRADRRFPAGCFLVDDAATGFRQCVPLQVKVLVIRRYAGVAEHPRRCHPRTGVGRISASTRPGDRARPAAGRSSGCARCKRAGAFPLQLICRIRHISTA